MNTNKDNYKDIERDLKQLKAVQASDELKTQIELLTQSLPHKHQHTPGLLLSKAAFITIILILLAGGGVYASEKVKPGSIIEPIKRTATHVQNIVIQETSDKNDSDLNQKTPNEESTDNDIISITPVEDTKQNTEEDKDNNSNTLPDAQATVTPSPTPINKPMEVLNEVIEQIPQPAQGVVDGVSNTLQGSAPIPTKRSEGSNKKQSQNTESINIEVDSIKDQKVETPNGLNIELNISL